MLNEPFASKYKEFYEATTAGAALNERECALVGMAAAMALNCQPCTLYYKNLCEKTGIADEEIGDVLAKVMAVAAGQKRIQYEKTISEPPITSLEGRRTNKRTSGHSNEQNPGQCCS